MYRHLPAIDTLIAAAAVALPHAVAVDLARAVLDEARRAIAAGGAAPSADDLVAALRGRADALLAGLRPALNATGVIIHTNLGRAPLSQAAIAALAAVAADYSNLEYDLAAGERGSRHDHLAALLAALTGAEASLVVNNNAAAVLLMLAGLCAGREVIVSRGQAVEIGGGFRIPDVLRQSGARLVEVGTTNRTYARDYAAAVGPDTAAILTVHRSNFQLVGFTHDPADSELRSLAAERGVLWLDDWGSGSLLQPAQFGLAAEATIPERVAAGCDVVCFSGDKLLGGPQAGLIVGRAAAIAELRAHPLVRALRVDKLTLAALEATLLAYVHGRAPAELPVWQMISAAAPELERRALALAATLRAAGLAATVIATQSAVGGGSLPGATLPSWAVAVHTTDAAALAARLRAGRPAVVGRLADGVLVLDLRTVLPASDGALAGAVVAAGA